MHVNQFKLPGTEIVSVNEQVQIEAWLKYKPGSNTLVEAGVFYFKVLWYQYGGLKLRCISLVFSIPSGKTVLDTKTFWRC